MPRPGPAKPLIALRLAEENIAELDEMAKEYEVTRSDIVRGLLREALAFPETRSSLEHASRWGEGPCNPQIAVCLPLPMLAELDEMAAHTSVWPPDVIHTAARFKKSRSAVIRTLLAAGLRTPETLHKAQVTWCRLRRESA